jgi:hypothetical protein
MPRLRFLSVLLATALAAPSLHAGELPLSKTFIGQKKFHDLMHRAHRSGWAKLPIGDRVNKFALALQGTPYVNYTLELDDRIEAPSVNMNGMDCWTLFGIALAMARLSAVQTPPHSPEAKLRLIELDRYRGGRCTGRFDSRLHHLEDWIRDNEQRGLLRDITADLGGEPLHRTVAYMGKKPRLFRQLRADPSLVPAFVRLEKDLSRRGITYIPKSRVRAIEPRLRDGDIISIVTTWPETYTSHVGLASRDKNGVLRFLHASRNHRKVLLDDRLSDYLASFKNHAGIFVARPLDLPAAATPALTRN